MITETIDLTRAQEIISSWHREDPETALNRIFNAGGEDALIIYAILGYTSIDRGGSRTTPVPVEYIRYGIPGRYGSIQHCYTSAKIAGMLKRLRNAGFVQHHSFEGVTDEWNCLREPLS